MVPSDVGLGFVMLPHVQAQRTVIARRDALSQFRYPPLLSESFLRLRLFSPDECMVIGLLGIDLEKQRGNWNAAAVLGVRD